MSSVQYQTGTLVEARGREWVVLPEKRSDILRLRPLGGSDDDATVIYLPLEWVVPKPASFSLPDPDLAGDHMAGLLLRDALRMKLRAGSGPFRSFGNLCVEPRSYQLVPLLMALRHDTVRLLISDDVGIGKTIEAGLIVRELLDRGEITRLAVLCPPHLCDQWQHELLTKFTIQAEVVRTGTAARLERGLPAGKSIFEVYPYTVVSLDFIKQSRRCDEFQRACPELVVIDEAHSCVSTGGGKHQRYKLLRALADDSDRHMLFLTATPHSGNDEAFYNLLGLLKTDFTALRELEGAKRENLRERLAQHFVQRRRPDIAEWHDSNLFPDRQTAEVTYALDNDWGKLFNQVLDYARDMVEGAKGMGYFQQRMSWWAALALLRCISSSPAAASLALRTRLRSVAGENDQEKQTALEALGLDTVFDGDGDDTLSLDETVPGALTELVEGKQDEYRKLQNLAKAADELRGKQKDPKLANLVTILKELTKDGFHPVIFCRYIATAHYLAAELAAEFSGQDIRVEAVTGEITSEEREDKVTEMKDADKRILVATDCLSEGINLQELFTAVIHYDLSWNPTRHEQREGRVDRFGQRAKIVKTVMLYGTNNPVDGAVLQVILRKADKIRKELGVSVPLPTDSNQVMQAVMEKVLFTGEKVTAGPQQLTLDLMDEEKIIDTAWDSAKEKAKETRRTVFAQSRLKPEVVLPEWHKAIRAFGGEEDVQRFVLTTAERLNAPLEKIRNHYKFPLAYLPPSLQEQLQLSGFKGNIKLSFKHPDQSAVEHVHRTHPIVIALADYVAEQALAERDSQLTSRCGALFTRQVAKRTTIMLLRLRNQIVVSYRNKKQVLLAEECLAVAVSGSAAPQLMDEADAVALMSAEPSKNMEAAFRKRVIAEALDILPSLKSTFNGIAEGRARDLRDDHRRVREASAGKGLEYEVKPCLPVDVIGVYVLQPDAGL